MSKSNLVWVAAVMWLGCTSTNDPAITPTDAGADAKKADAGGSKDGGANSTDQDSGSTGNDSGAAATCTPLSGGLPCDPGKIFCGSKSCDAKSEDCCVDTHTGSATCAPKGTCSGSTTAGLGCDEAADCAAGEVCCFTASGVTPTGSLCQTGPCPLGDFSQSCRGTEECAAGNCVEGSCSGYKIQTCGAIPSTACQ